MAMYMPRKRVPFNSIAISLSDIKRVYERLLVLVSEQADIEISAFAKPEDKTDAEFKADKDNIRAKAFRITVTLTGSDGDSLFGDDIEIFSSPNTPNTISTIYVSNISAYQNFTSNKPRNSFELYLDFSKPPLVDLNNPVSSPTPNNSHLTVEGDRDAWVAAVSNAVVGVIQHKKTKRYWMHRAHIYDLGLMIIGLPFGFYICLKLSSFIDRVFGPLHAVVSGAAYFYVMFFVVWAYRVLVGYTKWAFPTVELTDNKDVSNHHRVFWWAIVIGLVGNFIWEALKSLSANP